MSHVMISLTQPPPAHFEFHPNPDFKYLRRYVFCLYGEDAWRFSLEQINLLCGVLVNPGPELTWEWKTPLLLLIHLPDELLPKLTHLVEPFLLLLERTRQAEEQANVYRLESKRIMRDRSDLVREHLSFREDLLRENAERRQSQKALALSEERLRQTEKMKVVGQLAGGIAHDFNNMLCGILVASDMLETTIDNQDKELIRVIKYSASRASELTAQLLTFARKHPGSLAPVNVHQALKESVALLQNTVDRKIRIHMDLQAKFSVIQGDMAQLQSAFLNLGINAAQAMPDGGDLTILTQNTLLDKDFCYSNSFEVIPGHFLAIEFRDSGCGIPLEYQERIFEPFFTTKPQGQGTGLGLAAVFGTVQHHQGAITVCSQVDRGSRFQIYLPLSADSATQDALEAQTIGGSGQILVIEDEAVIRKMIEAVLKKLGYQVLLAENGRIGLDVFQEQQSHIDLVLLDKIMPEMDGLACFRELKKIKPEMRIILISGYVDEQDVQLLKSQGLSGFLPKPFRMAELSQLLADVLHEKPALGT